MALWKVVTFILLLLFSVGFIFKFWREIVDFIIFLFAIIIGMILEIIYLPIYLIKFIISNE